MADKASLIIALSGDYRSKKEVGYTLVPAIGRRVLDLGGNVEKGDPAYQPYLPSLTSISTNIQAHWQLSRPGLYRADCGGIHNCRKVGSWSRSRL